MYKKIIFLLLITVLFSGCAKETIDQNKPAVNQAKNDVATFNCQENEKMFQDYSWFFENKNYATWCEECINQNGKPQISHDVGPFCNIKTNDAGKKCTDSSQCKGYCLAENKDDNSGFCTEYEQLGDGCGWFELINGKVAELCVS
jgi:hypothetical protein